MTAADEWPAGKYQLIADSWDQMTSEPGKPFEFLRHVKGDVVDLNAEDARRLGTAGAIIEPGSVERAAYARALAQYEAAKAMLPPQPEPPAAVTDSPASSEPPGGNASLEAWQAYATSKGATAEDLDGRTRDQLREQYGPQ